MALLRHIHEIWPPNQDKTANATFVPTEKLRTLLVTTHPEMWGPTSSSGKTLTAKRLGFLLADSYKIHSDQPVRGGPRGYHLAHFVKPWTAMGIPLSQSDASDASSANDAGNASDTSGASDASDQGRGYEARDIGDTVTNGTDSTCGWCGAELVWEIEKRLRTCSRCQATHGNYLNDEGERSA